MIKSKERIRHEEKTVEYLKKQLDSEKETKRKMEIKLAELQKNKKTEKEVDFEWNVDSFYKIEFFLENEKENLETNNKSHFNQFAGKIKQPRNFRVLPVY